MNGCFFIKSTLTPSFNLNSIFDLDNWETGNWEISLKSYISNFQTNFWWCNCPQITASGPNDKSILVLVIVPFGNNQLPEAMLTKIYFNTQPTHYAIMTSLWRQNDVISI